MAEELLEEIVEEESQKDMYMTFKTGNEYFGISINNVNEIIGMQPITEVPEVEDYVRGLINLRGKIIPEGLFHHFYRIGKIDDGGRFIAPVIGYTAIPGLLGIGLTAQQYSKNKGANPVHDR